MLPTHATAAAAELRKLADCLDRLGPDALIDRPTVYFTYFSETVKEAFLALTRVLPRPLEKDFQTNPNRLQLKYHSLGLDIRASVNRQAVCRLVAPAREAVYECEPLLTEEELAGATDAAGTPTPQATSSTPSKGDV